MFKQDTKQISSIFFNHFNDLMQVDTVGNLKNKIREIIQQSKIKELDKKKIEYDITELDSIKALQFYLTNSMLKYSGMGVINR